MTVGTTFIKDPSATLDFIFDWKALTNGTIGGVSDWLATGEVISSYTVTVDNGITKVSDSKAADDTQVVVWLSGGTKGNTYKIVCRIVTNAGRTDEQTLRIRCKNQ